MRIFDFDNSKDWFAWFDGELSDVSSKVDWTALPQVEFTDDAYNHILKYVDEKHLAQVFSKQLSQIDLVTYHGTRLTSDELEDVSRAGLRPLRVAERHERYDHIFNSHPEWHWRRERVGAALEALGPKARLGNREDGRVWACYSRSGLLDCDYTIHGAEIDHHVAYLVFDGEHAHDYLRRYGEPYIVKFRCTMAEAEEAVSPYSSRGADELSHFAEKLIGHWAFSKSNINHSCEPERDSTQMGFRFPVLPDRLISIESLAPQL